MIGFCYSILEGLLRTTLFLAFATALVWAVLKVTHCQSPRICRIAWMAAILQGLLCAQIPLAIAWMPALLSSKPEPAETLPAEDFFVATAVPIDSAPAVEFHAASHLMPSAIEEPIRSPKANSFADAARQGWPLAVIAIWLFGMATIVVIQINRYRRFAKGISTSEAVPFEWQQEFDSLLANIDPTAAVTLDVSGEIGPLLYRRHHGYSLIVPSSLWQTLTSPERIAILRHELGHYQRGDLWKSLAARLIALPHWFNPCAWYAVRRFDETAEWACDGLAAAGETAVTDYASTLLKLCESSQPHRTFLPAAHGSSIARRIRRILAQTKEDSTMKKVMICTAAALVLAIGLFRVQLVGEEVAAESKPSRQAQALVNAAKNTYESTIAGYGADTLPLDLLFAWSRRWLQAELDSASSEPARIAAYQSHSARMKRVYQKIAALHKADAKGGEYDKYWASVFHVAEAEAMLRKVDKTTHDVITLKMKASGEIDFDGREYCTLTEPVRVSEALARHLELLKHLAYDPADTTVILQAEKDVAAGDVAKLAFFCKQAGFTQIKHEARDPESAK